jgi:poly(A) polymerase Pap1
MSLSKNTQKAMTEKLGSFRLGVHLKSADNDALCMPPRIIERADFFPWFFELLKKQPEVKDRQATEKAFVPVIMNYDGIKINFLGEIPDNFDLRDDILQNGPEVCAFTERVTRMDFERQEKQGCLRGVLP